MNATGMNATGLDAFLAEQDFTGVVLIRAGDRTVYEAASGLATRRWNIQNTVDTRFDTASITKLFTSVAVLQQVGLGTLDLETSIHHYVDLDGTTIVPEVTLLHLLTQTSGIADDADEESGESYENLYAGVPTYTIIDTRDHLPLFASKPPRASPGVETAYSNAGYILAGLALERVTGMPYRQYIAEQVFAKAGMHESGFFDRRDAEPRVAEGWDRDDTGRWFQNIYSYPPVGGPAEGAHATAADLVRFMQAVRGGLLLDTELTEEFLLPQVEYDDETMYGFGLEFTMNDDDTVRSFSADGLNAGASGIARYYLEEQLDVVVLSNFIDGAWPVIREIDERLGG